MLRAAALPLAGGRGGAEDEDYLNVSVAKKWSSTIEEGTGADEGNDGDINDDGEGRGEAGNDEVVRKSKRRNAADSTGEKRRWRSFGAPSACTDFFFWFCFVVLLCCQSKELF